MNRLAGKVAIVTVHPVEGRVAGHETSAMRCHREYQFAVIDPSPNGRVPMTQRAAKKRLVVGQAFVHASIIGIRFDRRIEAAMPVGHPAAILPSIAGCARVSGRDTVFVDHRDPLTYRFSMM